MIVNPKDSLPLLLVEDDPHVRRSTARLLEQTGYPIIAAASGAEALQILGRVELGVVVLDLGLPEPDGLAICRAVRRRWSPMELPLLVVSGLEGMESRLEALAAGANDYLSKPAHPEELLCRIQNLVALRGLYLQVGEERDRLERAVERRTEELNLALRRAAERAEEAQRAHEDTLRRLALTAEYRDTETGRHLERMGRYSGQLARAAGLAPAHARRVELAAPLHDVGKIAVPDAILFKPGPLNDEEWRVMRQHPEVGHALLGGDGSPLMACAATIAWTHHERWDGSGYPRGLKESDIPIEGRIVAVADVYDALRSERPYKPAYPRERAISMLRDGAGSHLDARLVETFIDTPEPAVQGSDLRLEGARP